MYRKYRVGELPDIQIKYSELIRPFQALAQVTIATYSSHNLVPRLPNFPTVDKSREAWERGYGYECIINSLGWSFGQPGASQWYSQPTINKLNSTVMTSTQSKLSV